MKKLTLLFFSLLMLGMAFQSCNNSKTYAEMMADEKKAINEYIRKNGIQVLNNVIPEDTIYGEKEFTLFPDGVYMRVDTLGTARKAINGDVILVRYFEYGIEANGDLTEATSNMYYPHPDEFDYRVSGKTIYGSFTSGVLSSAYKTSEVPAAWLIPLKYVGSKGKVTLIVPHKMGHAQALKYVTPYVYEISYQIY